MCLMHTQDTHTHTLIVTVLSTTKTFSHEVPQSQAAGRAASHGNEPRPLPCGSPTHSAPFALGRTNLAPPPCPPPLLSEEEIAKQCGRSENGHHAWSPGPGQVFSRPWTLTSGCPAAPGRPHVPASSLLGDLPWGTHPPPLQFLFPRVGWPPVSSLVPFSLCQG